MIIPCPVQQGDFVNISYDKSHSPNFPLAIFAKGHIPPNSLACLISYGQACWLPLRTAVKAASLLQRCISVKMHKIRLSAASVWSELLWESEEMRQHSFADVNGEFNQQWQEEKGKVSLSHERTFLIQWSQETWNVPASKTKKKESQKWWCTPLIPALGRQRQGHLCEFKANLIHIENSRTARATQ